MIQKQNSIDRRQYLLATGAVVGGIGLAGCLGSDDAGVDDDDDEDTEPTDESENGEDEVGDIHFEYDVRLMDEEETTDTDAPLVVEESQPYEIFGGAPQGFDWLAVNFELVHGEIDAEDVKAFTSSFATDDPDGAEGLAIISPEEMVLSRFDEEFPMMESGTTGELYFRPGPVGNTEEEDADWYIKPLQDQYPDEHITAAKR